MQRKLQPKANSVWLGCGVDIRVSAGVRPDVLSSSLIGPLCSRPTLYLKIPSDIVVWSTAPLVRPAT